MINETPSLFGIAYSTVLFVASFFLRVRCWCGRLTPPLAGALATARLHIPVARVEAGLRSFDLIVSEEINRVLTDHISDLLFCRTKTAPDNLRNEGITRGVHLIRDVMVDALLFNRKITEEHSDILDRLGVSPKQYLVLTLHRPSNTDNREHMENIIGLWERLACRLSSRCTRIPGSILESMAYVIVQISLSRNRWGISK